MKRMRIAGYVATVALSLLVWGCGGDDDAPAPTSAQNSRAQVAEVRSGGTPFIEFLYLKDIAADDIASIRFTIQPKPSAASKAVSAEFAHAYLLRRGFVTAGASSAVIPVFGLYAGHQNVVDIAVTFKDGSSKSMTTRILSSAYTDLAGIFDRPNIIKSRTRGDDLGIDFMAMKPASTAPVVIDTDGEVRWVGSAVNTHGRWAAFHDNGFVAGEPDTTRFHRLELDGSSYQATVKHPTYTNFHHNLDAGRYGGLLGEFDAVEDGVLNYETIVAEFSSTGVVLKEWNVARIVAEHMRRHGDDPDLFVRAGRDWFHNNAATYDPNDNSVIISGREDFLIKLDYDSSEIIWILGDPTKYWYTFPSLRAKAVTLGGGGLYPIGQHSVSVMSDGSVMVFDNGLGSFAFNHPVGVPLGETRGYSSVAAYRIDRATLTGSELWRFDNGRTLFSDICSSAYEGRNGSVLVNFAAANGRTKVRLMGLDAQRRVQFDFEYANTQCNTSWNTIPIPLDRLYFAK
jgi:hypothetical protein